MIDALAFCLLSSVTRFGKILPLWQKFTSLWQIFNGLFLFWQNTEPTLANLWRYLANFHCCKWPKYWKIIYPSGHSDSQSQTPLVLIFETEIIFFLVYLYRRQSKSRSHKETFLTIDTNTYANDKPGVTWELLLYHLPDPIIDNIDA